MPARARSGSGFRCRTAKKSPQNNQRDVAHRRATTARENSLSRRDAAIRSEVHQASDRPRIRNLPVALLQRTAEATGSAPDKYLRLGIDGPEELQNGFPATREELFGYRGIILGTVEASAFTPEQQRMLEDFVDVRGGGLLALGGPRSFSEGGWAGTPLADALPITLDRAGQKRVCPPYYR